MTPAQKDASTKLTKYELLGMFSNSIIAPSILPGILISLDFGFNYNSAIFALSYCLHLAPINIVAFGIQFWLARSSIDNPGLLLFLMQAPLLIWGIISVVIGDKDLIIAVATALVITFFIQLHSIVRGTRLREARG
jgi:hypothetical protein